MDQKIKVGSAVRLKGGGPIMTALAPDGPPPEPPIPVMDLALSPPWKPGGWLVAWHIQGALKTATLPGDALNVVEPPENTGREKLKPAA